MAQFFLFILLLGLSAEASQYSLADLEALAQEGSHQEFIVHAMDVRPSERLGPWKAMVAKMADAYAKEVLRGEIKEKDFREIERLWTWPSLRSDEFFKARRLEIGLRYLKSCLKEETPCWSTVKAFWEADPTDPDTGVKLAELVSAHKDSPLPVWTFLEVGFKSPLSEFYCKKELPMRVLWSKLELDYVRLGTQGDLLKKIDDTVHPDCLPALHKEARARLLRPQKSGDREFAYQVLASQSKVDQKTTDFFYVVYLLENPSQGEHFNYAWNRLRELGNASFRRDAVLDMMRTLDPLPDDIMISLDETKKRVVLSHFKRYFPEYLDLYVGQCLSFYGGKKTFPDGNPTIHCQDLMNSGVAPQVVDPDRIREFQTVRKI